MTTTPISDLLSRMDLEQFEGHTEGPWRENGCVIEGPKTGLQVAQIQYRAAGNNIGFASQTKDEAFANARLIAASPDLLQYARDLKAEVDRQIARADAGWEAARSVNARLSSELEAERAARSDAEFMRSMWRGKAKRPVEVVNTARANIAELVADRNRMHGTLQYILAQAKANHPGVLSVIVANAQAALDDGWQATARAALKEPSK